MRPLIFLVVGYITGISWGLYLNINIVPAIFFGIFRLVYFLKEVSNNK